LRFGNRLPSRSLRLARDTETVDRLKEPYMRAIRLVLPSLLILTALAACAGENRTFGERVRDTVDPPSGPVESAGRAMDRAVDRVLPN